MEIFINEKAGSVSAVLDESRTPKYQLILAHGAGAGMNHKFMNALSTEISARNGNVLRFNFPYMEKGRKAPGSPKEATSSIEAIVNFLTEKTNLPIFLSGKSYGGRIGSHLVADNPSIDVKGLVYFGFPLHAPGRDSKDRASHLSSITIPQLFIQGTNDKLANFGMMQEVASELQNASLHEVEYGDHSFKVPKKKSGKSEEEIIEEIANAADDWIIKQLT